ncbi:MAG: VWA-like domain-containing protein [Gemmatimonadales bacterium]|nr:VWA-like domain-containing protein [Gemmatimonadales bacterium]
MAKLIPFNLQAARRLLLKTHPYLASAAWAVVPVEVPEMQKKGALGPIGVDNWGRLYFDPAALSRFKIEELSAILYHELWHLLRKHHARAEAMHADPVLANATQDAEINDDIDAEKLPLPAWAVRPKHLGQPDGKLWEEYYAAIESKAQKALDRARANGAGEGSCGSGAAGQAQPWEQGAPAGSGGKEGAPHGIGTAETELIRRQVAESVAQQKGRGDVPAAWARFADEVLTPQVDWRKVLRAQIRRALQDAVGQVDYSYSRPSRRQAGFEGIVLPALRQPVIHPAVVVDTSGSMNQKDLAVALAEVRGVIEAAGLDQGVRVICCDAAAAPTQRVFDARKVQLVGGGGTDMGAGITAACALRPVPEVVIVVTDGATPWPVESPKSRVVVCLVLGEGSGGGEAAAIPAWAGAVVEARV